MSKTTNKYAPEVRERAVQKISTLGSGPVKLLAGSMIG